MLVDTHVLRDLARDADGRADDLRLISSRTRNAAVGRQWVGEAQVAMSDHLGVWTDQCGFVAGRMEDVAQDLRDLADRVDRRIAELTRLESAVRAWVKHMVDVESKVDDAFSAIGSAVTSVVHGHLPDLGGLAAHLLPDLFDVFPWKGALPMPGHLDWEQVEQWFHGRGIRP